MSDLDSLLYKELVELIPQIIATSQTCLQREFDAKLHDPAHVASERQRFQEVLTFIQGRWTIDVLYVITIFHSP